MEWDSLYIHCYITDKFSPALHLHLQENSANLRGMEQTFDAMLDSQIILGDELYSTIDKVHLRRQSVIYTWFIEVLYVHNTLRHYIL